MMRQVRTAPGNMSITQGEYAVSADPSCMLSTILGSCVSTCLWDPQRHVGGMNHVLVARSNSGAARSDAEGVNAMELLINALIRLGADRSSLRAKVFGGAKMITGLSDIGNSNGLFMLEFLDREGIPCAGQSLGGTQARQIRFYPTEGRALVKFVSSDNVIEVAPKPVAPIASNDVELF